MPASATSWTTDVPVSLKVGARYRMRVTAVNGAGLAAVHYTNGLLVDPTPPKVWAVASYVMLGLCSVEVSLYWNDCRVTKTS